MWVAVLITATTLAGIAFKVHTWRRRARLRKEHPGGLVVDPDTGARAEAFSDAVVLCALAVIVAFFVDVEATGKLVIAGLMAALLLSYWMRYRAASGGAPGRGRAAAAPRRPERRPGRAPTAQTPRDTGRSASRRP